MLFPSICDVIRNLSGMWKIMFPTVMARYVDVPQNFRDDIGGAFYAAELNVLRHDLGVLCGRPIDDDALRRSIASYNENRRLVREVYAFRAAEPWKAPSPEVYMLMRAGLVVAVEEHSRLLVDYMDAARKENRPRRDNTRVVVTGAFCEQPPLNLLKSIELAGATSLTTTSCSSTAGKNRTFPSTATGQNLACAIHDSCTAAGTN